jgi:2-polyprenyl-3-methyl-5-hydroxy-6-metoxy-1,4-benzoquinol methylase
LSFVVGPDVLDVGCTDHTVKLGQKVWVHGRLRERFPDCWGIDISSENIEAMRESGFSNLHVADAQNFSLQKRFDTIVAGELIEHLENPGEFLRCAREHLKPGGRIVLTTPNVFAAVHFVYAFVKFPKTCSNAQHTQWFCPRTMHALVERVGMQVAHWELLDDFPRSASWKYNLTVKMLAPMRLVFPSRLIQNNMLFVITA